MRYKILGGEWGETDWYKRREVYIDDEAAKLRYEKGELALVVGYEKYQMYTPKIEPKTNSIRKIEETNNQPTIFKIS